MEAAILRVLGFLKADYQTTRKETARETSRDGGEWLRSGFLLLFLVIVCIS